MKEDIMNTPLVSVLIPSTGRLNFLKTTIDSFLLLNTYPNIELVVVESLPTKEAREAFNLSEIQTDACIKYVEEMQRSGAVLVKHFKLDWLPLGTVMNFLLNNSTGEYIFGPEDDCETVCDPKEMFLDAIELLKFDNNLIGVRCDLTSPDVNENDPRFSTGHKVGLKHNPISDYLFWPVTGGAPFYKRSTLYRTLFKDDTDPSLGGFIEDHELHNFGWVEVDLNQKMLAVGTYMGIMQKYYGCVMHIGNKCVDGRDRQWSADGYKRFKDAGWFGKRK